MKSVIWSEVRMLELVREIQDQQVLVLGDLGVDCYTLGRVERISPEAPVPIVIVEERKQKLGLAANVAENIHALGSDPYLCGLIGEDRVGQEFRALLKKQGLREEWILVDSSRQTSIKERVVSHQQQLLRIDEESLHPVHSAIEDQILKRVDEVLDQVKAVIIEDYAKGMLSHRVMRGVLEKAKKADRWVIVDPNVKTPIEFYRGATFLTPNLVEAEALAGMKMQDLESLKLGGYKIIKETGAQCLVVTLGKEGMAIFTESGMSSVPTYAREVYDVSGAGDTVVATLSLSLCAGASIEEACVLANLAAGIEVGKSGTATVSSEELVHFLKNIS